MIFRGLVSWCTGALGSVLDAVASPAGRVRKYLVAAVAAGVAMRAAGHGYLATPAARNVQHNSDWCPHCLNAGGPWLVYSRGRPARHGVCGDRWDGPKDHEAGGKFATPPRVAATYLSGQKIVAKVVFTANHRGRWSLRLCPVPAGSSPAQERRAVTQACFDRHVLRRADGKGAFTNVPGTASRMKARYVLPKGLRCSRCVMQWTYETGNSCNPVGIRAPNPGLDSCAVSTNGEQFWNCADVRIL